MITPPPLPPPLPSHSPPPLPRSRGKAKTIIAIVLAAAICLLAFVGYRVVKIANMAIDTLKNRPADREHVVEAPDYETLLGEGLSGSGFHFTAGDSVYLCTSLHQFDGRMPGELSSFEFDAPIKVRDVAHRQDDIQVLTFQSDDLAKIKPLPYSRDAHASIGLPVYIYAGTGVVEGHVSAIDREDATIRIRMAAPFAAAGSSGSPIVSGETGTVIAVLLGANSPEAATRVDAELLQVPASLFQPASSQEE